MTTDDDTEFEFDLWEELGGIVARAVNGHERSQQTAIGPSGMGTPCNRKLAYRLAEAPALNNKAPEDPSDIEALIRSAAWRPTVGTAVHLWLAGVLEALNAKEMASAMHSPGHTPCRASWCSSTLGSADDDADTQPHTPRYGIEIDTAVGTVGGDTIYGHVDVYDRMKRCVIDWKIVGPKSLKDKRSAHLKGEAPSEEYRVQTQIYARGIARGAGQPVKRVALCFLPMNGELKDGFVWSEPYDPEVGAQAFKRARAIHDALGDDPDALLPKLKTAPDYCHNCDWFKPGVTKASLAGGCGGDKSIFVADTHDRAGDIDNLIG